MFFWGSLVNFFYFVNPWDECVKYVSYVSSWMLIADGVTLLGYFRCRLHNERLFVQLPAILMTFSGAAPQLCVVYGRHLVIYPTTAVGLFEPKSWIESSVVISILMTCYGMHVSN